MCADTLSTLLSGLSSGQEGNPLQIAVTVTPSDEVVSLRQQVAHLQDELTAARAQLNRAEYLYRCSVLLDLQILDYCRDNGIKLPRRLVSAVQSQSV